MMRLTLDAATIEELHDQIEELYTHLVADISNNCECCDHPDCPKNKELHDTMRTLGQALADAAPVEETPAPAPVSAPEPHVSTEPIPAPEDVRAVLNDLRKAKGVSAVKDILGKYGAANFPTLNPADYAAVMKEAVHAAH